MSDSHPPDTPANTGSIAIRDSLATMSGPASSDFASGSRLLQFVEVDDHIPATDDADSDDKKDDETNTDYPRTMLLRQFPPILRKNVGIFAAHATISVIS